MTARSFNIEHGRDEIWQDAGSINTKVCDFNGYVWYGFILITLRI